MKKDAKVSVEGTMNKVSVRGAIAGLVRAKAIVYNKRCNTTNTELKNAIVDLQKEIINEIDNLYTILED